jgi:hypothetical protein
MQSARSRHDVPIRLTEERWFHVTQGHAELAGCYHDVLEAIDDPDAVYEGRTGELLATKEISPGRHLVAVYREVSPDDGFLVTAFVTTHISRLRRRNRVWPP